MIKYVFTKTTDRRPWLPLVRWIREKGGPRRALHVSWLGAHLTIMEL